MSLIDHQNEKKTLSTKQILMLSSVIVLVLVTKLMPYLLKAFGWEIPVDQPWSYIWNLSPMLPLAIVAGATLSRKWAILLPVATWFAGDIGIWLITGRADWVFYPMQPIIYLLIGLTVFVGEAGSKLSRSNGIASKAASNLLSGFVAATLFFLISNFLVWATGRELLYAYTLGGLLDCYAMAIPFYRNSLVGIAVYVPMLTGLLSIAYPATETELSQELSFNK